ncbi:MAG: DUF2062 domain-containing protein [Deltaproteobacteria bacterium]|nr:DUF2062 domain-containing protein [Deltaproteobacteria bacterium]
MKNIVRAFFHRRVAEPLRAQLRQGVSARDLALALALGVALGVFPVLGTTTALCAIAGISLRLNQPAIQVANYLASPLQLLLFIPFFQAGAALFGLPPVPFTFDEIQTEMRSDFGATAARYLGANARAVVAWAVFTPVAALGLYGVLRASLRRMLDRGKARAT